MTINELANVTRCNIDNETGIEISHDEKWGRVVNALGFEAVKSCIPFSLEDVQKALKTDKHMNNLPMKKWDNAGGFHFDHAGARPVQIPTKLTGILRNAGITSFSPSDTVCILKCAARMWVNTDGE